MCQSAYDDHETARGEASSWIRKEKIMRLDKYLKVSRLIKRRTVANEACDAGRVLIMIRWLRHQLRLK